MRCSISKRCDSKERKQEVAWFPTMDRILTNGSLFRVAMRIPEVLIAIIIYPVVRAVRTIGRSSINKSSSLLGFQKAAVGVAWPVLKDIRVHKCSNICDVLSTTGILSTISLVS